MSTATSESVKVHLGGWTPYEALSAEDKVIFDEALEGFVGVSYKPYEVSKQVVAGMNYRFKCRAKLPGMPLQWEAIVEIYKPLEGKAVITGIVRL